MNTYLLLKTIHIISVISWMAGLLYFYRLFIYHRERGESSVDIHSLLSLMEKRLFNIITAPAMLAAFLSGVGIVWLNPVYLYQFWFQVKAGSALLMIAMTLYGLRICRNFEKKNFMGYSGKQLRIINEIPALLMILIVIMVIFRPL